MENKIPTIKKLSNIVSSLEKGEERFIILQYSHAFSKDIYQIKNKLGMTYQVILFSKLINVQEETLEKPSNIFHRILIRIIQYIVELEPIVALVHLLANLALDVTGYNLKKTEVRSLQKFLYVHKKPKNLKRIKKIVIVPEFSELSLEDAQYMEFVGFLITNGYITSAALLVLSDQSYDAVYKIEGAKAYSIYFSRQDFEHYMDKPLEKPFLLEIINKVGIEHIDKLQNILNQNCQNRLQGIKDIIHLLIDIDPNFYARKELEYFLKICSLLFEEFKLFDLESLNNKISIEYKEALPTSIDAKILKELEGYTYSFTEMLFREYFQKASHIDLRKSDCLLVLAYLKNEYPTHYVDLAITSQFVPLSDFERISYFIIAYYHKKSQQLKFCNMIKEYLKKDCLGKTVLSLERYRGNIQDYLTSELLYQANKAFDFIQNTSILPEAKLCVLNYIADVVYEIESEQERFIEIFNFYIKIFADIKLISEPKKNYVCYVLDAIVFSTGIEDYGVQKKVDKLVQWVNDVSINDYNEKIRFYKLGNLLYALDNKKAVNFTRMAFELSENNILLHEETRLNYSVSLLGDAKYTLAFQILSQNKIKSPDYLNAFKNNTIVAGFLSNKYSAQKTFSEFKKLAGEIENPIYSDYCILINNYIASLLINNRLDKSDEIEKKASHIVETHDKYHAFYAMHNLLILYFLQKDRCKFDSIYERIELPYLLRKHDWLMKEKLSLIKFNFDCCHTLDDLWQVLSQINGKEEYSSNLIITPVIWGLMERWFK